MVKFTKQQASEVIEKWGDSFWLHVPLRVVAEVLGLFTWTELARRIGKSVATVRDWAEAGLIPSPSFKLGQWSYYTLEEVKRITAYAEERKRRGRRGREPKVTDDGVAEMRKRWIGGEGQASIARAFGVTQSAVSRLIHGSR